MTAQRSLKPLRSWQRAIQDSDLRAVTKHIALNLGCYMSASGTSAFPSLELQASDTSRSKSTVSTQLQVLVDGGWLRVVKAGGGRGHRTEYEALIPEETVRTQDRFSGGSGSMESASEATGAALRGVATRVPDTPRADEETVRGGDRLSGAKGFGGARETVRSTGVKGSAAVPEGTRTLQEGTAAANAAAATLAESLGDAAAAHLEEELQALGAGRALRELAYADPVRAIEWIQVAKIEAANPAGFVRAGLESGESPSARGGDAFSSVDRTRTWITEVSWRFDSEDAHVLLDERCSKLTIDEAELAELHELVDQEHERRQSDREAAAA